MKLLFIQRASSRYGSGCAGCGMVAPFTATHFRFFDPITAPSPPRPAALRRSVMMQAIAARFSPAAPMVAVRTRFSPRSASIASCVWTTLRPHMADASLISTSPLWIHRYTGRSALPCTTTASKPARFSS